MIRTIYILILLLCASGVVMGQDPTTLKKAQDGDIDAQFSLACGYEHGTDGLTKNDEKYIYWLTQVANHRTPITDLHKNKVYFSQYQLGKYYLEGDHGLKKDMAQFVKWMKKASVEHVHASKYLGDYYYDINDKQEAIYWYKKFMDEWWKKFHEEDDLVFSNLRKLGVTYHPADYVNNNQNEAVATSNTTNSTNNQGNQVKEYMETVPIQVWQACGSCNGSGQCHICYGSGWTLSYNGSKSTCFVCHGTGKCTSCAGHGGQNVVRYEQRKVYR